MAGTSIEMEVKQIRVWWRPITELQFCLTPFMITIGEIKISLHHCEML